MYPYTVYKLCTSPPTYSNKLSWMGTGAGVNFLQENEFKTMFFRHFLR